MSYVDHSYFSFPYAPTEFDDGAICSSAVDACSENYDICTANLGGQGDFLVTIDVPGGGGITVDATAQDLGAEATSICSSLSSEACGNLRATSCEDIDSEKMDRVINMAGLMDKIESLPSGKETLLVKSVYSDAIELSGGETQKLMLARALYKDAPIIILDEPTAALDPIAENEIYQKYNELTQNHTSIFISHRLSSTRFCDRIIFIENGGIVEEGDHFTLMKQGGKYKEMYDMQAHYYKKI